VSIAAAKKRGSFLALPVTLSVIFFQQVLHNQFSNLFWFRLPLAIKVPRGRPSPPPGHGGEWKETGRKLVDRDKGSLTEQQTEGTVTTTIQIRRKYDTNSHNRPSLPDRTGAAHSRARIEFLPRRPPTRTQRDGTWYGIPGSVWPGGVSPPPTVPLPGVR